jgi:hypothetical protein
VKLVAINGPKHNTFCRGCNKRIFADDIGPFYVEEGTTEPVYCHICAAAMVYEDPTRSISTFYRDTEGTEVDHRRINIE